MLFSIFLERTTPRKANAWRPFETAKKDYRHSIKISMRCSLRGRLRALLGRSLTKEERDARRRIRDERRLGRKLLPSHVLKRMRDEAEEQERRTATAIVSAVEVAYGAIGLRARLRAALGHEPTKRERDAYRVVRDAKRQRRIETEKQDPGRSHEKSEQ